MRGAAGDGTPDRLCTGQHDGPRPQFQLEALRHAGCRDAWIFRDTTSGARTARPGLEACLRALEPGDTLVVWRLDRLGRSMTHLVSVIEELLGRQVGFRALCDGVIDTTSASGELIFHIFSALAQFERRLIQERTRAGLAAARARGKTGGRQATPGGRATGTHGLHHVCGPAAVCAQIFVRPYASHQATFYRYVALGKRAAEWPVDATEGT